LVASFEQAPGIHTFNIRHRFRNCEHWFKSPHPARFGIHQHGPARVDSGLQRFVGERASNCAMKLPLALKCHLNEEGLYLTFSDGKTFFYPQSFLFAVRFPYAKVLTEVKDLPYGPGHEIQPSDEPAG
jgi:hypothetical protein